MRYATNSKKAFALMALACSLAACSLFSGRETTGQYVDDTTITAKVKEAFVADSQVKASQVNVETMQGVVQLSGFVDSASTEARAVRLAKQVNGVKDVQDNISVRTTR
jgi:hyperosmotically inducible protein